VRYAILSDIHGNIDALQAVLADAAPRADGVICLGDVVGYGPEPERCLELMAERAVALVGGNHEHAPPASSISRVQSPGAPRSSGPARWGRPPPVPGRAALVGAGDATLVHASPMEPEGWDYLVSADDGFEAFPGFRTRLCFVGHSHRPAVWSLGSWGPEFRAGNLDVAIEAGRRYIVNVGSVGQPRDRDARAGYAIWDAESHGLWGVASPMTAAVRRKMRAPDCPGPGRSPGSRRLTACLPRTLMCAAAAVVSGLASPSRTRPSTSRAGWSRCRR
jgi:predicted phosphodiesterase